MPIARGRCMIKRLLLALTALVVTTGVPAQASWWKMPASELLGREVASRDGRPLGEIEDLVIDVRNARVQYAVLAFGGWMGLGEELYAVPAGTLAPEPGTRRVVLAIDTAPLVNVPGFRRDEWPGDDYWRGIPLPLSREECPPLRQFVRASALIGRDTTDRTGEHAGAIEDVVLDLRHGRVLHVLFDYDESWGPDEPPLRLAPQVFSFPLGGGAAVVNLPRERLAKPEAASG